MGIRADADKGELSSAYARLTIVRDQRRLSTSPVIN
jgi:hypothetical protein